MSTSEGEIDYIRGRLDNMGMSALTIYDVAKVLPHPYDAIRDMANHWSHDFIGLAFYILKTLEKNVEEEEN